MAPSLERLAVLLAVALLAAASVAQFLPRTAAATRHRVGITCLAAVVVVLAIAIAGRWIREAQGPFLTMYDVLLSNVFSLALVFVAVTASWDGARRTLPIVAPLLLVMAVWLANAPPDAVLLPATFDNSWLWVHVVSGKLFLGLCMIAAAAATLQLARPETKIVAGNGPAWSLYFLAFLFHTIMLIAGAAWAHTAWGRFWSWDGLEVSTLVTWLLIGITLHARATFKSMPDKVALSLVVASFVMAFMTFFGLPFLSVGPHKGIV